MHCHILHGRGGNEVRLTGELMAMVEATLRPSVGADVLDCLGDLRRAADSIFLDAAERLSRYLPGFLEPTEASIRFRTRIEHQPWHSHRINYNYEANEFNQAFFLKNFYKCLLVSMYTGAAACHRPVKVVDIGAGAGTFSIAWQLLRGQDNILLVDTSEHQLCLATRFAEALGLPDRRSLCSEFPAGTAAAQRLRLASYWFCEQNLDAITTDREAFEAIIGPGTIVVDYSEVIDRIFAAFPAHYDVVGRWRVTAPLTGEMARLIGESSIRVYATYVRPAHTR